MKKFRFLNLLLLALTLVFAAACGCKEPESNALLDAKNMLHGMYKDDSASTPDDYELIYQVLVDGVGSFKVTWTVEVTEGNPEDAKVVAEEGKKTVIDVNKYAEEDTKYILTATITSPEGDTMSQSYERVLPAFKSTSWAEYAAAEEGALVNVQGVVTAFGGNAGAVTVYFEDEDGGYYGYNLKVSDEVYAALEVGKTILASGEKDLYNGTFEILDIAKKEVAPKDITALFADAKDAYDPKLQALQGSYVTIKQVEMDKVDGKYYYFTKGAVSMYVYASSSSVFVDAAGMADLAAKTVKGQTADITGIVGMFNGAVQIIPLTTDAITHVTVELSGQEVLNKAKDLVNELAGQVYVKDLALTTSTPQGATIAWTSANTDLIANDGKLGNYPLEETAVKLTAVITAGSLTETVEIEVKVAVLEVVEGAKELVKEEGALSIEEAWALAKDTEVVVEATVKFVNPGTGLIVTDGANNLFVYTKGDLSANKAGDLVVVKGKMGTYNQAPQVTGNPTVTLKATGEYTANPETKTMEEVNALDYNDPKNFGKEFKVTGKPVVSGNYVNFQVGDVTYSLYLSNADKEILKAYADKEIEIVVLTYNYYSKKSIINLFADVTTIVEK